MRGLHRRYFIDPSVYKFNPLAFKVPGVEKLAVFAPGEQMKLRFSEV
jgi:hypothetical protein